MAVITKELALKIVRKLGAVIEEHTRAHDLASVYHGGKLIAEFGIRRGSRRDQGHDHIPSQLYIGPRDARRLGECPLSKDDWLGILSDKGLI